MRNLILIFVFLLGNMGVLCAQEDIVKFETPVEDARSSASSGKAVLTIISPNADLTLIGSLYGNLLNASTEYVKGERRKVGSDYHYVITFTLNADFDNGGIHSEVLTVSNDYGSKDCSLSLKMGKSYTGRFEIPVELICVDEGKSVYAASNAARLRFISDVLDELTIRCNEVTLVKDGQAVASLPSYITSVRIEGDAVIADFNVATHESASESFKRPRLSVSTRKGESLSFALAEGNSLDNKSSYQFRILRQVTKTQTVQKDLTFQEALKQAEALEAKYDFEAAANMYQEAMDKVDCPLEQKEVIRAKQNWMLLARKLDYYASVAEKRGAQFEISNQDSAYYYYNGARGFYNKLSQMFPERGSYKEKVEKLTGFIIDEFKNTVQKEVTLNNQVITGKVTLADGFIGNVAGVHIYEAFSMDVPKAKKVRNDYKCIGRTDAKGNFKLIIEHDHPVHYLYFYRDKKVIPIDETTQTLNVVLGEE